MNVLMRMSRGEAELEAALQRAEAQISRARSGDPTTPKASQLRNLIEQRSKNALYLRPKNLRVACEDVTLDGFDIGDYRLRPHHYERLSDAVLRVTKAIPPNMQVFGTAYGRGDDTGTDLMNMGLSFSRALEVKTQLEAWFALVQIGALIEPRPLGKADPLLPNPTSPAGRQRNRSVRFSLCIGLPLNTPMPQPPEVIRVRT